MSDDPGDAGTDGDGRDDEIDGVGVADDRLDDLPPGVDAETTPNVTAMNFWEEVIDDMEATAEEYREAGWETTALHPGDVTVIPPSAEADRYGLDVLVPNNEFEELTDLLDGGVAFDSFQVYRAVQENMAFVVVAMEDTDTETAVVYPAFYDLGDPATGELFARASEEGRLTSYLRILTGEFVELTHEDPSLFHPEEGS